MGERVAALEAALARVNVKPYVRKRGGHIEQVSGYDYVRQMMRTIGSTTGTGGTSATITVHRPDITGPPKATKGKPKKRPNASMEMIDKASALHAKVGALVKQLVDEDREADLQTEIKKLAADEKWSSDALMAAARSWLKVYKAPRKPKAKQEGSKKGSPGLADLFNEAAKKKGKKAKKVGKTYTPAHGASTFRFSALERLEQWVGHGPGAR